MGKTKQDLVRPEVQAETLSQFTSANSGRSPGEAYLPLPESRGNRNSINKVWFAVLLLALIGGGAKYFSKSSVSQQRTTAAATVTPPFFMMSDSDADLVKTQKIQEQLMAGDIPKELEKSAPQIIEKVKVGEMKFYTFTLYDFAAEDHDMVQILVDGLPLGVADLNNAGLTIAIPLEAGKSKSITLKAVQDGGGGVTLAVRLMNSEVNLKPMQLGESQTIDVRFPK